MGGTGRKTQSSSVLAISAKGNCDLPMSVSTRQVLRSAGFEVEHLINERVRGAQHATRDLDILKANGFETSLRGEQIGCPARKKQPARATDFPHSSITHELQRLRVSKCVESRGTACLTAAEVPSETRQSLESGVS